jgi:Autophagocytosis associated protein, active-site domain./Autophagocytosis associated protein C-terminal./Autophagocytosis associated protein (Atg3), N-terminal domain.
MAVGKWRPEEKKEISSKRQAGTNDHFDYSLWHMCVFIVCVCVYSPFNLRRIQHASHCFWSLYLLFCYFCQYLITRNVPCASRVSTLENSVAIGEEQTAQIEDECGGDDWLVSKVISPEEQQRRIDDQIEEEFDILDNDGETMIPSEKENVEEVDEVQSGLHQLNIGSDQKSSMDADNGKEHDEYADMEEFEDEAVMQDEAAVAPMGSTVNLGGNIMKVRTYDLSITYDKYYQTPRVFMIGYASEDSSQPLTGEEMLQDVMSDYANRTVTIDPHPHVSGYHASIHPCQHGAVMKTIVKNLTKAAVDGSEGKPPSVEMYLFIFLKFVSSIIPTINYDFTMDVTASTEKGE